MQQRYPDTHTYTHAGACTHTRAQLIGGSVCSHNTNVYFRHLVIISSNSECRTAHNTKCPCWVLAGHHNVISGPTKHFLSDVTLSVKMPVTCSQAIFSSILHSKNILQSVTTHKQSSVPKREQSTMWEKKAQKPGSYSLTGATCGQEKLQHLKGNCNDFTHRSLFTGFGKNDCICDINCCIKSHVAAWNLIKMPQCQREAFSFHNYCFGVFLSFELIIFNLEKSKTFVIWSIFSASDGVIVCPLSSWLLWGDGQRYLNCTIKRVGGYQGQKKTIKENWKCILNMFHYNWHRWACAEPV